MLNGNWVKISELKPVCEKTKNNTTDRWTDIMAYAAKHGGYNKGEIAVWERATHSEAVKDCNKACPDLCRGALVSSCLEIAHDPKAKWRCHPRQHQ